MKFVAYDESNGRRIIIATHHNLLASINTRNGEIVWRQVFEKKEKIDSMLHMSDAVVISQSGGHYIRCLSPQLGDLVWEINLVSSRGTHSELVAVGQQHLAVLTDTSLTLLDLRSGEQLWSKAIAANSDRSLVTSTDELVTAVGITNGNQITVATYDLHGTQTQSATVSAASIDSNTDCVLASGHLVCVDALSLHTLYLAKTQNVQSTTLQELGLASSTRPSLVPVLTDSYVGLKMTTDMALLTLNQGQVKVAHRITAVVMDTVVYDDRLVVVSVNRDSDDTVQISAYDVISEREVSELSASAVPYPHHRDIPRHLACHMYRRRDGSVGVRLLLEGYDHSLLMINQPGGVAWQREEALAHILSVEMVDLPASAPLLAHAEEPMAPGSGHRPPAQNVVSMFIKRISSQISQLKDFVMSMVLRRHHYHPGSEDDTMNEDDEELTRDEFNLHKMIVATTVPGKVIGMDSLTGQVLWQHLVPNLVPFSRRDGTLHLPLYVLRTTSHYPLKPYCTVIGQDKDTGHGIAYSFDPITGHAMDALGALDYSVEQIQQVQQMDERFLKPVLLLDSQQRYHVIPEEAREFVSVLAPSMYTYTADEQTIHGYAMHAQEFIAEHVWSLNVPHSIVNIVGKRPAEHVHSQGIVLMDRSVLYKYINPNLLVLTTVGIVSTGGGDMISVLTVYLLDAVTGHIVFHCNHRRAQAPVHIVHSENWIVYSYWNSKKWRIEVVVLELYEGVTQFNSTTFSSLSPPPPPTVLRQAFIFPSHVTAMTSTLTERGLTNKHVLMALETGGILSMPKMMLDPRRPIVPTAEHKEEGIMPYMPELPRPFEALINYNQSVLNIRAIHTAPAGLESTSLILAYGLDLFSTRLTPSKPFDVLKEDFDYLFIGSVLFGMVAVSVISRKLAARRALHRAWK